MLAIGGIILALLFCWEALIRDGNQRQVDEALRAGKAWRERFVRVREHSDAILLRTNAALRQANRAQIVADSLRSLSIAGDTLPAPDSSNVVALHWRGLYLWEKVRADSLGSALDRWQLAYALVVGDRNNWRQLAEEGRAVNLQMDEALRAQQCRIVFLPCPSTTVIAVGSAVVGIVLWESLRQK